MYMEQQNQDANAIFMETVSLKVDQQDQKIEAQAKKVVALENRLKEPPAWVSTLTEIKVGVQSLQVEIGKRHVPVDKIQELSNRINAGLATFSQPTKSVVIHHHHLTLAAWVAIGIFLILCLVSCGWYMTAEKGDEYRASDFKYRHLKLIEDSAGLAYLYRLDSLYRNNTDSFENGVIGQERLKQEKSELEDRLGILNGKIVDWKKRSQSDNGRK